MPYTSMDAAKTAKFPTALKSGKTSIPLTLAQVNRLAALYDAVKDGDSDNPMAVAITQFKNEHRAVDGGWVKKKKALAEDRAPRYKTKPKILFGPGRFRAQGGEWVDKNSDGLPSPGEFPRDNSDTPEVLHDFDGFVFTDPTNRDTDGDGQLDGTDNDPLINPRAFGNPGAIIVRLNAEGNADIDKDGLGNGMDMGNDLTSEEGPFRPDLLDDGIVPEAQVEDLFGADWDGNGLWRTTDMRTWSLVIDPNDPAATPPDELFALVPDDPNSHRFYATQTFDDLRTAYTDGHCDSYGKRGIGMGWQDLLVPSGRTGFIPDALVWTILYAWRVPGFDIDGDGFIGVPNLSSTAAAGQNAQGEDIASVALKRDPVTGECTISDEVLVTSMAAEDRPFDDRVDIFEGDVGQGDVGAGEGLPEDHGDLGDGGL